MKPMALAARLPRGPAEMVFTRTYVRDGREGDAQTQQQQQQGG
jgi:hypothetical protein